MVQYQHIIKITSDSFVCLGTTEVIFEQNVRRSKKRDMIFLVIKTIKRR
jgi:hypothetical protein